MNLSKEYWKSKDFEEFRAYQESVKGSLENQKWEQRIVNTKLDCLAKTSTKAREMAKQIKKGNYFEFLDNIEIKTHCDSLVCAFLLNSIKNFADFEPRLDKFVKTIDNWASCDTLKFDKKDKEQCKKLSYKYIKSDLPFVRRVGVNFWFDLIKDEKYLDDAFNIIDMLQNETEYYVNMCGAWLLSFCMVQNREKTINYFENNRTNSFIINKAISKCRDSFRISKEDKDFLLKFKVK